MVLWEITLGTAYFLGLKKTYKLALRIQRRLIAPKHPKLREFVYRRVRSVFDVAIKVHLNIQQRDLEVGRNLGNWILRWLDKMKPSAHIRAPPELPPPSGTTTMIKKANPSATQKLNGTIQRASDKGVDQKSGRHLFSATKTLWSRPFPSMAMTGQPPFPGSNTQYRQCLSVAAIPRPNYGSSSGDVMIRNDIKQWLLRK